MTFQQSPDHAPQTPARRARLDRRGTVLVFSLGILTLLFLIGFTMLSVTRSERIRVDGTRQALSGDGMMAGIEDTVIRRLVDDVWHRRPDQNWTLLSNEDVDAAGKEFPPSDERESNEAFDAPGPYDKWLSAHYPYIDFYGPDGLIQTGDDPSNEFDRFLVWPRVGYLGHDIFNRTVGGNVPVYRTPLMDASSADRTYGFDPDPGRAVAGLAGRGQFDRVPAHDAKSTGYYFRPMMDNGRAWPTVFTTGGPVLPRGWTIAESRRFWDADPSLIASLPDELRLLSQQLQIWRAQAQNADARFPYFDKDLDGQIDLYDSDGDGVADAPLSFEFPGDVAGKRVYAAIRVIDHGGMLNLNTVGALDYSTNGQPNNTIFDGLDLFNSANNRDRQLRGRRTTEIVLDPEFDWDRTAGTYTDVSSRPLFQEDFQPVDNNGRAVFGLGTSAVAELLNFRRSGRDYLPSTTDAHGFYGGVSRTLALGGAMPLPTPSLPQLKLLGAGDEAALRRGFVLASTAAASGAQGMSWVESYFPFTLNWSQSWIYPFGAERRVGYRDVAAFRVRSSGFDLRKYAIDRNGRNTNDDVDGFTSIPTNNSEQILGLRQLLNANPDPKPTFNDNAPDPTTAHIRRPAFTTISYDTTRMPVASLLPPAGTTLPPGKRAYPPTVSGNAMPIPLDSRPCPWKLGIPRAGAAGQYTYVDFWFIDPADNRIPPDRRHREKVDLNKPVPEGDGQRIAEYLAQLTWAIYQADPIIQSPTVALAGNSAATRLLDENVLAGTEAMRLRRALQLAVNVLDYRDSDDEPYIVVNSNPYAGPNSATNALYMPVVGEEKHPFITECMVYLASESSKDAVGLELYYPYDGATGAGNLPANYELMWEEDVGTNGATQIQHGPLPLNLLLKREQYIVVTSTDPATIQVNVATGNGMVYPNGLINWSLLTPVTSHPQLKIERDSNWIALARRMDGPNGSTILWPVDRMVFRRDVRDPQDTNPSNPLFMRQPPTGFGTGWQDRPASPDESCISWAANVVKRDTRDWLFTWAYGELKTQTGSFHEQDDDNGDHRECPSDPGANRNPTIHSLGLPNTDVNLPAAEFVPNIWAFRNVGLNSNLVFNDDWAFDSVGELSRVLAFGAEWRQDYNADSLPFTTLIGNVEVYGGEVEPTTQIMLRTLRRPGIAPRDSVAVGRVNWFEDPIRDRYPGRLNQFLGCYLLNSDGINNDGDNDPQNLSMVDEVEDRNWNGYADLGEDGSYRSGGAGYINGRLDSEEAAGVFFRDAGKVNINTAPSTVLHCVPYMTGLLSGGIKWDVAAQIVAFRERHQVLRANSTLNATNNLATPKPGDRQKFFRSLSDLARLPDSNGPGRFFGQEGTAPPEHVQFTAGQLDATSPDFDRSRDLARWAPIGQGTVVDVSDDVRARDVLFARWMNVLTVRGDVYTAYVTLFDEDGKVLRRSWFTVDRSPTVAGDPLPIRDGAGNAVGTIPPPPPRIVVRQDVTQGVGL